MSGVGLPPRGPQGGSNRQDDPSPLSAAIDPAAPPESNAEEHFAALQQGLPPIDSASLAEIASALLAKPGLLRKCFEASNRSGVASTSDIFAFLRKLLRTDAAVQGQLEKVTKLAQQISAECVGQLSYTRLEAALLKISSTSTTNAITPKLDPAIGALYNRIAMLRASSQRQMGKKLFSKAASFTVEDIDARVSSTLMPREDEASKAATEKRPVRLTADASRVAREMAEAAVRERVALQRDIVKLMGSHWEHGAAKMAIQFEGQSKTEEVGNSIDAVRPGDKVAVYQLRRRAHVESSAHKHAPSAEIVQPNGAEATVLSMGAAPGLAHDLTRLPDPFDAEFAEQMQAARQSGAAGARADAAAEGTKKLQEDFLHQVEDDTMAQLLVQARKQNRIAQSVDLAEELNIAESLQADTNRKSKSSSQQSKQTSIKTHRVTYNASTHISSMEVEFDGGDLFPKG
mmetsp:Transcript_1371/g.3531  ORF Transcript_1371/g.3531 Transcript_1371/m.3531 type:complete len:459 (+) Transcript_1371:63-1439(+)